ncbi:unnamed protein product [Tuber melanosporum]|jgi:hypothetical protein|uniref:(Perigord truffle) hypothetical protein n=1 Tax=Tuber melanosporum (strain Mel28) TaxID=656061 RepID=D5G7R3_TUBMM|nr:uncharacterized protein GSTUM_00004688001 [Tuber melanosporum]CAZ80556.1 unnamed protein product [Tuber melanosporum]
MLSQTSRTLLLRTPRLRTFTASSIYRQAATSATATPAAIPKKRPVGAFRGGLFGFLLGSTFSAGTAYFYWLEEYRVSNELLTEDVEALRNSIQRVEAYVRRLEENMEIQKSAPGKGKK